MSNEDLAINLSSCSLRERIKIFRAARLLRKYAKLTKEKVSDEEELDKELEELDKE